MVRNYVKKTTRKQYTPRKLKKALHLVRNNYSLRIAAAEAKVNYACLHRLVKKTKEKAEVAESDLKLSYSHRAVFTKEMEDTIAQYYIDMATIGYGLSTTQARELAYETAILNNLKCPAKWNEEKKAGIDWLHGFQKRHPQLTIRTPEACSIARAQAFNKVNVMPFYDKLSEVLSRNPRFADGSRVINLDETSTSTVQSTRKILSPKGVKQVHKIKTAERGVSVTTCCIVTAHGSVFPPVLIFPRKKFVAHMLTNAFPGSLGLANDNGYMTKEAFVEVMQHIIKQSSASKDNPLLLLMDNVDTHFSAKTLNLAKEHGITILTFPPHCTHKMQPLDLSFFGPFKAYYDAAVNDWILRNPATSVTIYQIAEFVKIAINRASSIETITNGFKKAGIFPFDRNIFNDSDFVMASVTEQPDPAEQVNDPVPPASQTQESCPSQTNASISHGTFVSPMQFKGLPKAKPATNKRKPRKKGKCRIATDTPEKAEIEEKERETKEKKRKAEENKKKRDLKKLLKENEGKTKQKKNTSRALFDSDDESDDSATVDNGLSDIEAEEHPPPKKPKDQADPLNPEKGDYVLVLFGDCGKYYVGKIIKTCDNEGDCEISYLRLSRKLDFKFVMPNVPDLCSVSCRDMKVILPKPSVQEGLTKRQASHLSFEFDFSNFKMG